MLRDDALERGMEELSIAYGWAAISIGFRLLEWPLEQIDPYGLEHPENPATLWRDFSCSR
jgi:hypothetical protein